MNHSFFDNSLMNTAVAFAEDHMKRLHEIPENAFSETETTAYIRSVCENYPVDIIDIRMETGLVCYLDAGKDETVALRADIDAVPTEHGPRHLCGHDAHASTLLGAMHYLTSSKDDPAYNVLFIFQPAEEGTMGAKAQIVHGIFDKLPQKPIRIFGIHNRPEIKVGDVVVHRGALMSEKSIYRVTFKGKPGHGAKPHKCIDPIPAAASFVEAVQTIISRNINPLHPAICTVNSIKAGEPDVPVAEKAFITGYIRSFNHDTHSLMEDRIRTLAEGTAAEYRCEYEIEITPMVPAVVNSDDMYEIAYRVAERAVGIEHIVDSEPDLASEDFAIFGRYIPSFFYWLGSGEPGRDNPSWHDANFKIARDYFKTAVPLLTAAVMIQE